MRASLDKAKVGGESKMILGADMVRFASIKALLVVTAVGVGTAVAVLPAQQAVAAQPGSISGTVRAAGVGTPVAGAAVEVLRLESGAFGTVGPRIFAGATAAADGTYTVSVPASDTNGYWVCFDLGLVSSFESQCYVNRGDYFPFPNPLGFIQVGQGATTVSVAPAQKVKRIDASLRVRLSPPQGAIAGKVTDTTTGKPLRNVTVYAYDATNTIVGNGLTGSDGTYVVDNLPGAASYAVCFNGSAARGGFTLHAFTSSCFPLVSWNGSSAPPAGSVRVAATNDATTSGINTKLTGSLF